MSSTAKPLVLVTGATGQTARVIIDGLLESGNFTVAALTRAASASKPAVESLRKKGIEIRVGDYTSDSVAKLREILAGVDILISTVSAEAVEEQKPILAAAVEAGVKRILPSDYGSPGARSIRSLHDLKLDIQEYLRNLCSKSPTSKFTFVDIGWWMLLLLPTPAAHESILGPLSQEIYGAGDKKFLMTETENIGKYVARIVADPRTENAYVMIWDDELTLAEAREIAEKASGQEEELKAKRVVVSREQLEERAARAKEQYAQDHSGGAHVLWSYSEYMISFHFLGENTLENAKRHGALDVHELYPDLPPARFEDFVKEYYQAHH